MKRYKYIPSTYMYLKVHEIYNLRKINEHFKIKKKVEFGLFFFFFIFKKNVFPIPYFFVVFLFQDLTQDLYFFDIITFIFFYSSTSTSLSRMSSTATPIFIFPNILTYFTISDYLHWNLPLSWLPFIAPKTMKHSII